MNPPVSTAGSKTPPAGTPRQKPAAGGPPRGRIAKFITADVAESKLDVSDGQLPNLSLVEDEEDTKKSKQTRSRRPWFFAVLIAISSVAAIALWFGAPSDKGGPVETIETARKELKKYFVLKTDAKGNRTTDLESYQVLLRESQHAHARGHHRKEHALYKDVLRMLREEHFKFTETGLTGSREKLSQRHKSDPDLERLLSILLTERP